MPAPAWAALAIAWLAVCWLAFVFVATPLILAAVATGLMAGAIMAILGYLRVFVGCEDLEIHFGLGGTEVLGHPAAERRRALGSPYPVWDKAWPSYLSWQVERDVGAAVFWPVGRVLQLWTWAGKRARPKRNELIALFPFTLVPIGFLIGLSGGVVIGWMALAVVIETVAIPPRAARLLGIVALRRVDWALRWWLGAATTCPDCSWVAWVPGYRCRGADCCVVHRDVRPGRLGVWWRRCKCGERIPTMVLRAVRDLSPECPGCGQPLHAGAGRAHDMRIAVSGDTASGKTQLLFRTVRELTGSSGSASQRAVAALSRQQTGPAEKPRITSLQRCAGKRTSYLHLAEIPGRHFQSDAGHDTLWPLGASRRHVLTLNAMAIPWVYDHLDQNARSAMKHVSLTAAERPYRVLVAQLHNRGAPPRRCSLAVVLTRADVLRDQLIPELPGPGTGSSQLRKWLRKIGMHHLVEAAEHDFGQVKYYLSGHDDRDASAPFTWLMSRHRHGAAVP